MINETTKDAVTILAMLLSPVLGGIGALWTFERQQKDRFDVAISHIWVNINNAEQDEMPVCYINNKSKFSIAVIELSYYEGWLFTKKLQGTARYFNEPTEIEFPIEISQGASRKIILDEGVPSGVLSTTKPWQRMLKLFGRHPVWLEVRTVANGRKRVPATQAARWADRPDWLK